MSSKVFFSQLMGNQLYVKGKKCELHVSTILFLDYIIDQEGFAMDKAKVTALITMAYVPTLPTTKDLSCFLGFAQFLPVIHPEVHHHSLHYTAKKVLKKLS